MGNSDNNQKSSLWILIKNRKWGIDFGEKAGKALTEAGKLSYTVNS